MASSPASSQATEPCLEENQSEELAIELQELISAFEAGSTTILRPEFIRAYAKCPEYELSIKTFPDAISAALLPSHLQAVTQSSRSAGFDVNWTTAYSPFHVRFCYYPQHYQISRQNDSASRLRITSRSDGSEYLLDPGTTVEVKPDVYFISVSIDDVWSHMLELCLRPQHSGIFQRQDPKTETKRLQTSEPTSSKKHKVAQDHSLRSTQVTSSNPVLELDVGQTIRVAGPLRNDNYQLTPRRLVAATRSASIYAMEYSLRPGQIVVTKVIKGQHAPGRWVKELSVHEAAGKHPSIVRLFGCDARAFTLYLEYVEAQSLAQYSDRSGMCTCSHAAFTILSDIAGALEFIHGSGLVHNDIKPANILYSQTRGAVLIDFGLGGQANVTEQTGGTPWYVPPEFRLHRTRGRPGDIFALGVTMLYVLRKCSLPDRGDQWWISHIHNGTREMRSNAARQMQAWIKSLQELRVQLCQIQGTLEGLLRYMLLAEPETRYTAKDILKELESLSV